MLQHDDLCDDPLRIRGGASGFDSSRLDKQGCKKESLAGFRTLADLIDWRGYYRI